LDFTYLAQAESLGAIVNPGCFVTSIEPSDGRYKVHYCSTNGAEDRKVTGRCVVVAAGTLGTNELLLRSRDFYRTLPRLSARLGYGYSANGDFLGSIQNASTDLRPWEGPDVTSVIRYFDSAPQFTMAAPTFSRPVMNVLAAMGQGDGRWLRCLSPVLWPMLGRLLPWAFHRGLLSTPRNPPGPHAGDPARMTNLFAIGRDNANGLLKLKNGRLDIEWSYAVENAALIDRMTNAMREMSDAYGGTFAPILTWQVFRRIITVHSLGGCHLSDSPQSGVVSPHGEVYGYPGLYVADGSVIPTAIGFHPVMTISAVSEYISDAVVASC
jgi:cholesterol oxidase